MDHSGLTWRKSTHSNDGTDGDCVEVAWLSGLAAVRDSKNPDAGILAFPTARWDRFTAVLTT